MRAIFLFALAALVAAIVVPKIADRPAPATTPVAAAVTSSNSRTVVIRRDERGHFAVDGVVDGRRLGFMVDTGASVIALTQRDAARLGYHPAQREYASLVRSSNRIV